jgi:hypothetical protein
LTLASRNRWNKTIQKEKIRLLGKLALARVPQRADTPQPHNKNKRLKKQANRKQQDTQTMEKLAAGQKSARVLTTTLPQSSMFF